MLYQMMGAAKWVIKGEVSVPMLEKAKHSPSLAQSPLFSMATWIGKKKMEENSGCTSRKENKSTYNQKVAGC